ncbi:unnamed protein product [Ceutorhynchus assimilis]|uniref:C2H2-type domain-containing protein n=1 Tax=Ceutorhynchus assimilis TaxID=467358 RepID=A0A9N9QJP4_9CUCU|nr:unnamed protein product [Ceutorhynchus assimilis]
MECLVMNYFDDDPYNIVPDDVSTDSNTTSSLDIRDISKKSDPSESISFSTSTANASTTSQQTTIPDPELENTTTVINHAGTDLAISEQNGIVPNDNINKPKLSFRCNICNFFSKTRFSLARHQQVAHESESANIHIDTIETNLNTQNHPEKKICFRCDLCDFSTNIRFALARHQLKHHKESNSNNKTGTSDLNNDDSVSESDDSDLDTHFSFSDINDEFGDVFDDFDSGKDFSASKPELLFKATVVPQLFNSQKCSDTAKVSIGLKQPEKSHLEKSPKKLNFVCSHCSFEGKSERSLLFHLVNAHRELSSFCNYCDRRVPYQLNIEHTKKCKVKAIYKCPKCKNFKVSRKMLLKHQRTCKKLPDESEKVESSKTLQESPSCENIRTNEVKISSELPDSKKTLEENVPQSSNDSADKQYICNICSLFETSDKILFNQHLLMHLQSNQQMEIVPPENVSPEENSEINNETVVPEHAHEKSNIVDNEPSSLNKDDSLDEESVLKEESVSGHLRHDELIIKEELRLNGIGTRSYDCVQCPHKSKNQKSLQKHFRAVHIGKDFNCQHCSYISKGGRYSTFSHTLAHRLDKPIFKCTFCDFRSFKRVVSKHSVQMHGKNVEWQATMINCPHCSFVCKNQCSYKEHVRRHILTKEKLQKCEQCDFISFKINVIKHQNKCHVTPKNTIYRCTLCSFETNTKGNLQGHIHRHTKLKKTLYSCTKCNFKSLIANAVRGHLKEKHGYKYKRKVVKCDLCSYSAHGIEKLHRHKSYHATGSLTYKCDFCDYTSFRNTVKKHSNIEHNTEFIAKEKRSYINPQDRKKIRNIKIKTEEEIYHCDLCSYVSNFKYNLQLHIQKHRDNVPMINCTECDFKSFKSIVKYHSKHIHNKRIDNPKKEHIYSCDLCSYTAKWNSQFKNHSLKHTLYNTKVYNCKDCDYRGFRVCIIKHYRELHGKTITDANLELKQKIFECSHCSYTGKSLDGLKHHLLLHTEDKEPIYDCNNCNYRTTLSGIRRHSQKEHGVKYKVLEGEHSRRQSNGKTNLNTRDKLYNCELCSYTTQIYNTYKSHVDKHNDEGMEVIKCNYCDFKGFKTTVGKHIKAKHEVIFTCDKCSYSTKDKKKHINHLSLHTSETLIFKCSMCDFASFSLVIRKHMISEHPNRTKDQNVLQLVKDFCKNKDNAAVEKENVINHSNGD